MASWERIAERAEAENKRLEAEVMELRKLVPIAEKVLAQADAVCEAGNMSKAMGYGIDCMTIMKFRAVLDQIKKD